MFLEKIFIFFLSVGLIKIPALRDRKEDIKPLAEYFCNLFNEEFSFNKLIQEDAYIFLQNFNWPGNVKELEVTVRRVFLSNFQDNLTSEFFKKEIFLKQKKDNVENKPDSLSNIVEKQISKYFDLLGKDSPPPRLYNRIISEIEKPLITSTLIYTNGNQLKASEILGINRNTLRKKINELNISLNKSEYLNKYGK